MVQQLTYTRAIEVIPSTFCDIPNPSLFITQNTTTSSGLDQIYCTNVNLTALGIQPGDIVYMPNIGLGAPPLGATVLSILNSDILILNTSGITIDSGTPFFIYAGTQNDASKSGCVIYSISSADIYDIQTVGGDLISSISSSPNQLIPIQVKSVSISTNPIIALW